MKLVRTTIAFLALLLTAQSEPAAEVSVVIGRPIKILSDLGPDATGHYSRLNVRMQVKQVIAGEFKEKYFDGIVLRHVPAYVFGTPEYVAVIETREGKSKVVDLTEMVKYYCLGNRVVARNSLTEKLGPPQERQDHEGGTCWDWE